MARNLIRAGHEVALWSHSGGKAETLAKEGGTACKTPAEVAQRSECVFLCVGNTNMSTEVILGPEGLAAGKSGALTIVDCSTVSPSESRRISAKLGESGIDFLDAPCSGSKAGAEGASLTFMIGGDAKVFERVKPLLEAMGKQLYYCGDAGMGLQAKLSQSKSGRQQRSRRRVDGRGRAAHRHPGHQDVDLQGRPDAPRLETIG